MLTVVTVQRLLNALVFTFNISNALAALLCAFISTIILVTLQSGTTFVAGIYTYPMYTIEAFFKESNLLGGFSIEKASIILIVFSGFLLMTAGFGLILLIRPHWKFAWVHVGLVSLNIVFLLTLAYSGLAVENEVQNNIRSKMTSLQNRIEVYQDKWMNHPGELFTTLQSTWQCCGVVGPSEWLTDVRWFRLKYSDFALTVPDRGVVFPGCTWYEPTACIQAPVYDGGWRQVSTNDCIRAPIYTIYNRGCSDVIRREIGRFLNLFNGIAFSFAFLQLLGLIFETASIRRLKPGKVFKQPNNSPPPAYDHYPPPFTTAAYHVDATSAEGQAELAAICAAVIRSNAKF